MALRYSETVPPPHLRPFVHCLWHLTTEDPGAAGAAEPVLPDGSAELILHFADPFVHHGPHGAAVQPRAFVVGQITEGFRVAHGVRVDTVGVRFHPGGCHALFGVPMDELTDRYADLEALHSICGRALRPAFATDTSAGRRDVLVAALTKLTEHGTMSPVARAALDLRNGASSARHSVDHLARNLGLTPRQLARRFRQEVGIGPTLLGRIYRFQGFLRLMGTSPAASLTSLAHRSGYYDHSHLVRDFRAFAGAPPTAFFGNAHPLARAFAGL